MQIFIYTLKYFKKIKNKLIYTFIYICSCPFIILCSFWISQLYATVLAKDALNFDKAKDCLEKAIKMDVNYLEAYYSLVHILVQQQRYDDAVKLWVTVFVLSRQQLT